ncbi:MAG: class I SAM-dependent rRNA methyltransferase [Clostridia bacterium]|nr:class I SAM-dependent rRNA methyltransferase [Clostridia bacterium]
MYILTLKKGEERRILNGEPWVFANEVAKISGEGKQGEVCKVVASDGRFVCLGYINHLSKIIVRVLTYTEEEIDRDFFFNRIKKANDYRLKLGYGDNYRVVFGEADLLPALIVDKFGDYLSCQFLSLGMDKRKDMIVDILVELFNPKGVYERSDVSVRKKEGLAEVKGVLYGEIPEKVKIKENGLDIFVDIIDGQKTGYFLDQKENRDNIKHYVKDAKVLDCFCNLGGFSLCAAKHGAKKVYSADISQRALDVLMESARANGFEEVIKPVQGDVFELLRQYRKEKENFDTIILDPPAFTKSKDTVKEGLRGYKDINVQALKLLKSGGFLITCSCSQHVSVKQFTDMLAQSAIESGKRVKLVELRAQGKDHASLIGFDESIYLKVAVLYIL